jgi:hypothetical protein
VLAAVAVAEDGDRPLVWLGELVAVPWEKRLVEEASRTVIVVVALEAVEASRNLLPSGRIAPIGAAAEVNGNAHFVFTTFLMFRYFFSDCFDCVGASGSSEKTSLRQTKSSSGQHDDAGTPADLAAEQLALVGSGNRRAMSSSVSGKRRRGTPTPDDAANLLPAAAEQSNSLAERYQTAAEHVVSRLAEQSAGGSASPLVDSADVVSGSTSNSARRSDKKARKKALQFDSSVVEAETPAAQTAVLSSSSTKSRKHLNQQQQMPDVHTTAVGNSGRRSVLHLSTRNGFVVPAPSSAPVVVGPAPQIKRVTPSNVIIPAAATAGTAVMSPQVSGALRCRNRET